MVDSPHAPLTTRQQRALAALCDTFIPAVKPPVVEAADPFGFWARTASDAGVPEQLEAELRLRLSPSEWGDIGKLLDLLAVTGFRRLPQGGREKALGVLARTGSDARDGLSGLRSLTLFLFYSAVEAGGPLAQMARYPGPSATTSTEPALACWTPPPGTSDIELTADVVVVGSGAGGGVVAAVLAQAGLDVVVLEAGGAYADDAYPADERSGLRELYWRGGLTPTADGNVAILAGATLGGGTTVNWQNCVRPPAGVREEWARITGLDDVASSEFDVHLDAVAARIGATAAHPDLNGPNARLIEGAKAVGLSWRHTTRNLDPSRYDPESAGHVGYGDRSGSKQGTVKTYLADSVAAGARIVVGARVDRVVTEAGRATGVTGTFTEAPAPGGGAAAGGGSGRSRRITVTAKDVVIAAGALETPAVLLRSGIGGPAVGDYLRLHPVPMMLGLYGQDQRAWWGPPQAVIVDEFTNVSEGHGYLIETAHLHPGLVGLTLPWVGGRDHKLLAGRSNEMAGFIAVQRDHGHGRVTLDPSGEGHVTYPHDDAVDQGITRHALRIMAELHQAAGAISIVDLHPKRDVWRRGDDIDPFIDTIAHRSIGKDGRVLFSAHQMGSARMGTDPATSATSPYGHLHDVPNVWIGDTSVFPTAVGSNPMLTCMAMARRTARAVLASHR